MSPAALLNKSKFMPKVAQKESKFEASSIQTFAKHSWCVQLHFGWGGGGRVGWEMVAVFALGL